MAVYKVKFAERLARRLLVCGDCRVKLTSEPTTIYTSKQGIKYGGNPYESVWINELNAYVGLHDIKQIEYEDRFGNKYFNDIDWEGK